MEDSNERVDETVAASEKTRQQLDVIVAEMQNANDMVAQIAAASEQQSAVATEMNENVSGINLAANDVLQASQRLAEDSPNHGMHCRRVNSAIKILQSVMA